MLVLCWLFNITFIMDILFQHLVKMYFKQWVDYQWLFAFMYMMSDAQQDINAIGPDKHIRIHTAKIKLNLNVRNVMRKENVKMVLMSAKIVNMLRMKHAWNIGDSNFLLFVIYGLLLDIFHYSFLTFIMISHQSIFTHFLYTFKCV